MTATFFLYSIVLYGIGVLMGFMWGRSRREMGGMYRFNVYLDFPHGEFKLLETKGEYAENREDAKKKVYEYAQKKYKGENVSVMSVN